MRKRTREHEDGSPDSDQPIKMFSKYEVQGLLQQEVHSAMKQSESKMASLLERVQLLECEPKYDLAIHRLEAHIKKVKRRGDAAISYVRMLRPPGVKHNQRMLGSGLVDLTETETESGLGTVDISSHFVNLIMEKTRRNAYDAAFKLKAIDLAVGKGNRDAAQELGLNESMIRRWKQQREELTQCKKTTKAFRGRKSRWPELENELEDWVDTRRADGRGVSTAQIRLKAKTIATAMKFEDFRGGPSWCLRFLRRKGLSIRVQTSLCQQLPPDYEENVSNFRKLRSDSDEEDSAEKKRKVVDGFWQKMMSNKKAPDRKREKERNGKKQNIPLPPPTTPPPPLSPLPPVLSPQVLKVEASVVPVTRPPVTSPDGPVKTEGTVKMETTVKTEESSCPPVPLRVPPSQSELLSRLPPLPPTPFPSSLPLEAASYSIPQKPLVHLARIRNPAPCLVIHWRVIEEDPAAPDMDSYSIYIAQESHSSSVSPSWRNVGVVKALALPMAVTVTKYQSGTTYVIVVGKDRYGRYGPYSDIQTVLLA
ncbi:uncharacterized protein isoform X1 [Salmo salar]|uniref:Uncharacterized protein isoform X1 n=1 Tax=Salmo salar TaxID=8030 RepID=A0ABM3EWR1_SALSA|nr:uncharacterized protein LOC106593572 isoform X1 [Salmo salar]